MSHIKAEGRRHDELDVISDYIHLDQATGSHTPLAVIAKGGQLNQRLWRQPSLFMKLRKTKPLIAFKTRGKYHLSTLNLARCKKIYVSVHLNTDNSGDDHVLRGSKI